MQSQYVQNLNNVYCKLYKPQSTNQHVFDSFKNVKYLIPNGVLMAIMFTIKMQKTP